jgi:hypothetical protein
MAQKAKPVQPKSDPVIELLQRELKQQGFYAGDIDGQAGEKTTAAVARRDEAAAKAKQLEIDLLNAQGSKATDDAAAAATIAETERKKRYQDQASSGLGMATQSAANLAAPAAGTALGMALGRGVNMGMDKAQESRNAVLRGAADDRMAGRTTVAGAREGVTRAGAMPPASSAGRVASRMLPHIGLGGLSIAKGAQVLSESDPNGEFYPSMADRAAGLGYIGAGAGLTKQGLRYAAAPGVAPDAQALAVINSNQIRRNGAAGSPGPLAQALGAGSPAQAPAQPPALPPAAAAPQAAQPQAPKPQFHRDAKGRFAKLPKGSGAAGLAGALAYGMTPDRADAATGEATGNQAEALTNAGIAGGAAYGTSKLAQALAPALRGGLSMVGEAMAPASIDAMTDYSPDDLAQGRNTLARTLPQALQGGAVDQARQMATVPERGPQAQMAQDQRLQAEAMPMAAAQSLQIPEGIPAPNPDGSSPYGEAIANRINRMVRLGAPPEAIANLLNQAVR